MDDVLAFAKAQFLEVVLAAVALIILPYVRTWLIARAGAETATKVDAILNRVVQAALNKVIGTAPGVPVPPGRVGEVVAEAGRILEAGAPDTAKAVGATLADKVLARLEVADVLAGNAELPRAVTVEPTPSP